MHNQNDDFNSMIATGFILLTVLYSGLVFTVGFLVGYFGF